MSAERRVASPSGTGGTARKWPHIWRGRLRWRIVGFDYLCPDCWRYSKDDIPWCGQRSCDDPRLRNLVRKWRQFRAR